MHNYLTNAQTLFDRMAEEEDEDEDEGEEVEDEDEELDDDYDSDEEIIIDDPSLFGLAEESDFDKVKKEVRKQAKEKYDPEFEAYSKKFSKGAHNRGAMDRLMKDLRNMYKINKDKRLVTFSIVFVIL